MSGLAAARDALVRLLQAAYSSERAAYIAYHGHQRAVRDPEERRRIRRIGREELSHRRTVGRLLAALGAGPSSARELGMPWVGRAIWLSCFLGGWFLPMYGAARLERSNIEPYLEAARLARAAGHPEMVEACVAMAEVEWDHEAWLHGRVRTRWMIRRLPDWDDPPPRAAIRAEFPGPASRRDGRPEEPVPDEGGAQSYLENPELSDEISM